MSAQLLHVSEPFRGGTKCRKLANFSANDNDNGRSFAESSEWFLIFAGEEIYSCALAVASRVHAVKRAVLKKN